MPRLRVGGQEIAYREAGEARPPLLLLHGAGASSLCFAELLGHLGRQRWTLALDLPGHGRSPAFARRPPASELLERYRDLVAEAAERLGLGRFILAGHSMGGAVGLSFALAYPERLEQLLLIASAARLRVSPALLETIRSRWDELPALLAGLACSPASDAASRARWSAQQLQAPQPVVLADFLACDAFDLRGRLGAVTVPVGVLHGADDRLTPPAQQEQLLSALPRARGEQLARAGHLLALERPVEVAEALLRLIHASHAAPTPV